MKRFICWSMVLGTLAALPLASQAQVPAGFGQGAPRPSLSPYLNLNRGGNPAINYYGLVRPQIAAERAFQVLGSNIVNMQNEISQEQPVQTGIRSSFMTHGVYFMNNNAAGNQRASSPAAPPSSRSSRVR
jgi:hypothetical protein